MSKKFKYGLLLLLFNLTVGGELLYAQQDAAVSGIVRNKTSSLAIAYAKVSAVFAGDTISSVLSDKQGKFIFYALPEGNVDFVVKAKGYVVKNLTGQTIKSNKPLAVLIDLDSLPLTVVQEKTPKASSTKIQLTGTVRDTLLKVISGVSITIPGTKIGTVSDNNGKYILDVPIGSYLVFSFVDYASDTILVNGSTTAFDIVLHAATTSAGQEVVVTAYGQQRTRESVTGAITTVKPENLRIPSSNLTNALAGAVPGIIAYQANGQPGFNNSQFFVRGVATFGYSSSPLILIDNIESSATDLANLQVDDIASFSLLKDASATALYGARGANGVLMISTKKGTDSRAKIYGKFENSISKPTKNISLVDPITYENLFNEALAARDPTAVPKFDADKIYNTQQTLSHAQGSNPYVYPAVDWLNMLFKNNTSNQRANVSVRGGGQVATYYVSASYNLDNGILKISPVNNFNNNVKLQNSQFRSNIDLNITKTTKLSLLLSGNFNDYNGPITSDPSGSSDLWARIMYTSPVLFPAYYSPDSANRLTNHILFGNSDGGGSSSGALTLYDNPYADMLRGYSQYSQSTMNAQISLSQRLDFVTKGLNFQGMFYTQRYSYFSSTRQYNPYYYQINTYDRFSNIYTLRWLNNQVADNATSYLDYVPSTPNVNTQVNFQGMLMYDRAFGKHKVSATIIEQRQQRLYSGVTPDGVNTALELSLPYRNLNSSARVSYTYDNRYIIEPSVAYNGSERFADDHRFGFFPTIGVAWNVSNEKFWKGKVDDIITRLKFRGSYGKVGFDDISQARFFYLSSVNLNGGAAATFGVDGIGTQTLNGVSITNYANPDITWEVSKQADIGMDISFFNSLNLTIDVYKNNRSDIYMNRINIATMGLEANVGANLGTATQKGMEVQLDYSKSMGKDWSFAARGNFTFAESRYGKYEEPDYPYPWQYRSGTLINQTFGYVAQRLFVDDAEVANSPTQKFNYNGVVGNTVMGGDIKYKDINNDGVVNSFDQVPLGHPTVPEITYGFGGSARYKQFDINFFFQGNARVSFFIDPSTVSPFIQSKTSSGAFTSATNAQVLTEFADDHYSIQNQNLYAEYPRLGTTAADMVNNLQTSSWWMRNGAFLRLKQLEIGYTLPGKLLKSLHMSDCRFYFSGMNLFTLSKFKMWDVEQGGSGFAYPIQKVYNVGVYFTLQN